MKLYSIICMEFLTEVRNEKLWDAATSPKLGWIEWFRQLLCGHDWRRWQYPQVGHFEECQKCLKRRSVCRIPGHKA